jgi:hypothetical protein
VEIGGDSAEAVAAGIRLDAGAMELARESDELTRPAPVEVVGASRRGRMTWRSHGSSRGRVRLGPLREVPLEVGEAIDDAPSTAPEPGVPRASAAHAPILEGARRDPQVLSCVLSRERPALFRDRHAPTVRARERVAEDIRGRYFGGAMSSAPS